MIEFQSDEIEALQREIAQQFGFKLVGHRLELYAVPLTPDDDARAEMIPGARRSERGWGRSGSEER